MRDQSSTKVVVKFDRFIVLIALVLMLAIIVIALNPFSTETHFHYYLDYHLSILYSFSNLCRS